MPRKKKVVEEDVVLTNKPTYRCCRCGDEKEDPVGTFYRLPHSLLYKANDCYAPLCKKCVNSLFDEFKTRYGSERTACILMCHLLDAPFYNSLFDSVVSHNNNFSVGLYLRQLNNKQFQFQNFCTTITGGELNKTAVDVQGEKEQKWSKIEIQAKDDCISVIGYDPFDGYNEVNALLAEMDGFDTSKGIIILAATNRPEVLDKALLRPGRFDRRVIVERPDLKGRIETLKVHAKDVKMDETVDFEEIALATSGAVGSDLANMINEAALGAVKAGRKAVSQKDLFEAVEVVIAGKEKKDRILGDEEKHIVAYHEVGHALVMALQKESEPVQKITIVPRTMGALGYTMQRPEEEKYLNKKDEMLADLVSFFGGRAAEEVKFNSVTTGASNDIERATAIARAMVTQYGMSDEFGLIGLESITNRYLDGRAVMNCAETTAAKVDEVVMKMLKEAYAKAVTYIRENMDILDEAAEFLIQRETITGKEFMEIFNKYKNPVEESDKNVSETAENDAEISEAEVKTDSEIKTEEENTSTYNTGYAQWVEDDDDEE